MFDISAFLQGLLLGLGIFTCPGPKDIVVIRRALLQHSPLRLILVSALSDALLISFGVAGLSAVLNYSPVAQKIALLTGVLLMLWHGLKSARDAFLGDIEVNALNKPSPEKSRSHSQSNALKALLIISFLNPIVWLDTVLIVGTVGASKPKQMQLAFVIGAVCASFIWFTCIVSAGRAAKSWITSPHTWRTLDAVTAIFMFAMAIYIAFNL